MNADQFGHWGEDTAAAHLEGMGYEMVARNWRSEHGEIDLVTRHEGAWVFVEVKARRTQSYGTPEEAVTPAKQRRLLDGALAYLAEHDLNDVDWRVDVVAITVLEGDYDAPSIEVYQNAVSEW
jgi:putative endonuclease